MSVPLIASQISSPFEMHSFFEEMKNQFHPKKRTLHSNASACHLDDVTFDSLTHFSCVVVSLKFE